MRFCGPGRREVTECAARRIAGLVAGGVVSLALSGVSAAADSGHWRAVPKLDVQVAPVATPTTASQLRVPHWTGTATLGKTTYRFLMLGRNPTVAQTNPVTVLKVVNVSTRVRLLNSDGTVAYNFDPTIANACVPSGETVRSMILKSPVFTATDVRFGGTSFGHVQYVSGFQRGEFWSYTNPTTGINPTYAVNLKQRLALTMTVSVPADQWQAIPASACPAGGSAGIVSLPWWDSWATNTAFPTIRTAATSAGLAPDNYIVLFNTWNVHFSANLSTGIGGWHGWLPDSATSNSVIYATSDYDTSGTTKFSDVYPLTHEVGELINNPFVNDQTPAWGHIGQVAGCKRILEVGDPLTGTTTTVTSNGYPFTVQDLMYEPWFYQQSPSPTPNGRYDFFGNVLSPSPGCT
jgi:hypothetical protein